MEAVADIVLNAFVSIVVILFGIIVKNVREYLKAEFGIAGLKIADILAKNTVRSIDQIYRDKDIHGKEKFEKAKESLLEQLKQKGVVVTDEQLKAIIESAVNEMNKNS